MTIHREICFDHLESDLRLMAEIGTLVYVGNPGNWGDALIAAGTKKFFYDRGIKVKYLSLSAALSCSALGLRLKLGTLKPIMIFAGNGAFIKDYKRKAQIESIFGKFYHNLILPSTYGMALDTRSANRSVIMYRRDQYQSSDFSPQSKFCHDMAFTLIAPEVFVNKESGFFFREDVESPKNILLPKNNRDLSNEGNASSSVNEFFNIVGSFSKIYTNRLHVAIAGSLLNREVHLFPNSYFKNEAIYKSSLKPFFLNTHFHETTPQAFGLC
tara:strand:- start:10569 stop:11378 length:810 start_codon:yes stop_codon:yes gene_type:complete